MTRMEMVRIDYPEHGINCKKVGTCDVCGEKITRYRRIAQRQTPWNFNDRGKVKSISEIMAENREDYERWRLEPLRHEACLRKTKEAIDVDLPGMFLRR